MAASEPPAIPETVYLQVSGKVQELSLDEYVKGVVPAEMGLQKPIEALKAQAIAARSEAAVARRHAREGFDLCAATHCQVWNPKLRNADADRAVDETAGLVVTVGGSIAATPYFGHCDGHTRNSEDVWSGAMSQCRSVPCICGYSALYGHGVGMCQRGAMAMAKQGASAQEILKHYYTGVEITRATVVRRSAMKCSLVLGRVTDGHNQPRAGMRLVLTGEGGTIEKGTTADGRFWFTGLSSGQWELRVKGKPVRYDKLTTDGRNTLELQVAVPDAPPLLASTMPLVYPVQLAGTLGYEGVPVTIVDAAGKEQTVLSGSAPDFGPGGFVVTLPPSGKCTVRFLDQSFSLDVSSSGLWVRFVPKKG